MIVLKPKPSLPRALRVFFSSLALTLSAALSQADSIKVNLNESPFGPSPQVVEAIQRDLVHLERYTDVEAEQLVKTIAEIERIPAENVILGDILEPLGQWLAARAPGKAEIVYSSPGYTALIDAAAPLGGKGIAVPLDQNQANDLPALNRALTGSTQTVFLVNPHNPSGVANEASAFHRFCGELSQHVLVIVDEAYVEYTDSPQENSVVDLVRAGKNVVVFRTFGKIHGLASLTFGYALAPRAVVEALHSRGVGSPRSLNRLSVVAARAALLDQAHVDSVRAQNAKEREKWQTFLDRLGLQHTQSSASFVFFDTRRPTSEFTAALRAKGIEIGRAFPPYNTWARISIGTAEENLRVRAAVETLYLTKP